MITFKQKGNFNKIDKFFKQVTVADYSSILEKYGKEGVTALASAMPIDTGTTANSWYYEISHYRGGAKISWANSNIIDGVSIAVILQYGHGTRNGGYVQGRDYINPALRPILDKVANDIWREVSKL